MSSNVYVVLAIFAVACLPNSECYANSEVSKRSKNFDLSKLVRLVFPGIKDDGTAKKSVPIRSLPENESGELSGDMAANVTESLYVRNGAKRDIVLEIDVSHKDGSGGPWGGETLLALFRLAPKAKLLDVIDVRADRESGLWNKPAVLHGDGSDALLTYCSHLNAGEEYFALDLIEIAHDKFVRSKVNLPLIYNARTSHAEIAELPSVRTSRQIPSSAIFRVVVTGKLLEENGGVKKLESKTFQSQLISSRGRWRCPSCRAMQKSIEAMQVRFGFTND